MQLRQYRWLLAIIAGFSTTWANAQENPHLGSRSKASRSLSDNPVKPASHAQCSCPNCGCVKVVDDCCPDCGHVVTPSPAIESSPPQMQLGDSPYYNPVPGAPPLSYPDPNNAGQPSSPPSVLQPLPNMGSENAPLPQPGAAPQASPSINSAPAPDSGAGALASQLAANTGSLNFSEQSGASRGEFFPSSMIGDFFGSGPSQISVIESVIATGSIISGSPGSPDSDIAYTVSGNVNSSGPDFFSVGQGTGPSSSQINTFSVVEAVPGSTFAQPGSTTATTVSGNAYLDNDSWRISNVRFIDVPNPSANVVGRLKIGENSSPIPRDRIFLNYSAFNHAKLRPGGAQVHRFSPGFEKTLFSPNSSVEMRVPFASTVSNQVVLDGQTPLEAQFGDLFFAFKGLVHRSQNVLVSVGMSMTVPTASDLKIRMANGTAVANVENQSMHYMPFLGAYINWTDRLFSQTFVQLDYDGTGSKVTIFPNFGSSATSVTRLYDTDMVYTDLSFGYWWRRPNEGRGRLFKAITPIAEFHLNDSLERSQRVTSGNLTLGPVASRVQTSNCVLGSAFYTHDLQVLTLGYGFPVGNGNDAYFDGEVRAFWNQYF